MTRALFRRFLESRRGLGCTPGSLAWLETAYGRFQAFRGRRQVTGTLCRQYLSHLRLSGLPAAEVRGLWRGLRVFLRWAVEQGELDETVLLPGPPVEVTYRDALTEEDVERIVIAAEDRRAALLLWAFSTTGLRSEKLRALRWEDVDFGRRVLWTRDETGQRVEIPLPSSLADPLRAWKGDAPSSWVFSTEEAPLTATEVRQLVRSAGERAGFPFLAPGQLQYAWLRRYFRAGAPRLSAELQTLLAQPFRVRGLFIPNLITPEELRRAYDRCSPMEAIWRSQNPSRSRSRRKP